MLFAPRLPHRLMRQPVKAVPPQRILFGQLMRNCVGLRDFRQMGKKRGVEYRNLRCMSAEYFIDGMYPFQRDGVMQGRERCQTLDFPFHITIDEARGGKTHASMYYTMRYPIYIRKLVRVCEFLEYVLRFG